MQREREMDGQCDRDGSGVLFGAKHEGAFRLCGETQQMIHVQRWSNQGPVESTSQASINCGLSGWRNPGL